MCVRQSNAVCVTMSSQGGEIAVGDSDGTVHVINVDTDEQFINTIENAHDVCVTYLCLDVPQMIISSSSSSLASPKLDRSGFHEVLPVFSILSVFPC